MKTHVAALITVLIVFTLASVWTDMVQPLLETMAVASSRSSKSASASQNRKSSTDSSIDDSDEDDEQSSRNATRGKKSARSKSASVVAEEERLKSQLDRLKSEEAKLVDRQNTMKLLYDDIFRELAEVDEMRRRSASELAQAEQKVLSMALNNPTPVASTSAAARKSKAEARIASVVQDLMDRGSTPAAAALLSGLKDMEVAKVLSLLTDRDPQLALQLSNQVQAARQNSRRF